MCAYLEVAPPGLEPGTYRLVVGRSVQLSYGPKGGPIRAGRGVVPPTTARTGLDPPNGHVPHGECLLSSLPY
jgi:hypothetical protein